MPTIAEYTRTGTIGNQCLSVFGDFTDTKQFLIYGVGKGFKQCTIADDLDGKTTLTNQQAVLVLPPNYTFDVYAIHPVNNSDVAGKPIVINRASIYWAQKVIRPGETARIFGRNLAQNNTDGTTNSNVYFYPVGGSSAITATVTRVNPYCVEYTVPALTAGTQYDIYAHNGHGGSLGLSEPYRVTASAAITWGASVALSARQSGDLSDVERFERWVNAAHTAADFRVLNLTEKLYFHRRFELTGKAKFKILGNGKATAQIIAGTSATNASFTGGGLFQSSFNTVHFENLTIDANGNYKSEFNTTMYVRASTSLKFINCEIKSFGSQVADISNSNDTHFINCTVTGRTIYVGTANQTFMTGLTSYQTNDTQTAISIWRGDGFYAYNCTSQDLNPNGDMNSPDTFSMGRFITGNGSFGGQINWHIEKCDGKLLTPRTGTGSDLNSGEIYMWEGNLCRAAGKASAISTDGKNFTLPVVKDLAAIGRSWAVIVGGTGIGQYNKVAATTATSVTVEKEWKVKPDTTSVILVGHFSHNIVCYDVDGSGKSYATNETPINASSLFKPYGGCIESVIGKGRANNTRSGLEPFVTNHNASGQGSWPGYEGVWWGTFHDCTLQNNLKGIRNQMEFNHTGDKAGTTCIFGLTFRNVSIQYPKGVDVEYGSNADLVNGMRLQVYDNCTFSNDEDLLESRGSFNGVVFHNPKKFVPAT